MSHQQSTISPVAAELPDGVIRLADIIEALRKVPRLTYRQEELAEALGVSDRTVERLRSSGKFPRPDIKIGRMPLWRPATIEAWIARGGEY